MTCAHPFYVRFKGFLGSQKRRFKRFPFENSAPMFSIIFLLFTVPYTLVPFALNSFCAANRIQAFSVPPPRNAFAVDI